MAILICACFSIDLTRSGGAVVEVCTAHIVTEKMSSITLYD